MKFFRILSVTALFLLVVAIAHAQTKTYNYERKWRQIDSLVMKGGLTRSALKEVMAVYAQAKKDANDAQLVKSLVYRINLQREILENEQEISVREIEKEMSTAKEPVRSILGSVLAEQYYFLFQRNRWKIYDRTNTRNFVKDDIETWTVDDWHARISDLYLQSIRAESVLQQTSLKPFDPIIIKGNARYLRPTLYDLLVFRALEYLTTSGNDITKPAFAFVIADNAAYSNAATFASHRFMTADSASLQFKALTVFQRLLLFRQKDSNAPALIDADILRLQFVHQYAVMENSDSLYESALRSIGTRYAQFKEADQAWYLVAEIHAEKARKYHPLKDTANRYSFLEAKKICEQVIQRKESSEGKANCQNLLSQITAREFSLQAEKVNVPGQPFRMYVNYKNIGKLHMRLLKFDQASRKKPGNDHWNEEFWKSLIKFPVTSSFSQTLPATNDHQSHAVEIKINALPPGEYAVLASPDSSFSELAKPMSLQYFYISNIAYVNTGNDFFVLNRETGKPIADANIQVWHPVYDYQTRKWSVAKGQLLRSDNNGHFVLTEQKNERRQSLRLEITTGNDRLFLDDQEETYIYYGKPTEVAKDKDDFEKRNRKTFLFTDRSIYRPGQPVYFKGIMITRDFNTRQSKIITKYDTKIILLDANEQAIDSIDVTTNDFGSYSGKFTLPAHLLNGTFILHEKATSAVAQISMEEYKRPKFFVEYEKPKGTYQVNDTIRVTGNAKAYAGNMIGGALVKYRVERKARFLYPWMFWKWGYPRVEPQQIAHGVVTTAPDGKFSLQFPAIPDKSISRETDPVFDYEITADVTDINGETRSATTIVSVSYKSMLLSVAADEKPMAADSLTSVRITATNLAGEPQPAQVSISIFKLNVPQRLIRDRYWPQPDQYVMSREEYLRDFPNDEYSNETSKESWERSQKVFDRTDSVKVTGNNRFAIDQKLMAGWYVIEASSKDKNGAQVKDIKYVHLTDSKTGSVASPSYNWFANETELKQPGGIATVKVGSSAPDVFVIRQIDREIRNTTPVARIASGGDSGSNGEFSFDVLNNERKSINIPISENDRGGFSVYHAFVKHNRFFTSTTQILVPWTNKELKITYETYRDKTLPGSEEKWKVKIAGHDGQRVSTEVLTAMYDASLDQFKPHSWHKPDVWPVYNGRNSWNGSRNFAALRSMEKYQPYDTAISFEKSYDQLATNIYQFENEGRIRVRGRNGDRLAYEESAPSLQKQLQGRVPGIAVTANAEGIQDSAMDRDGSKRLLRQMVIKPAESNPPNNSVQIRKNFNETAFFFPHLTTDSAGNVEFSFTIPEALTQWKWMMLSHTKELALNYSEKTIVTQKELMVQPNIPRFVREGDRMDLSAKLVNLGEKEVSGQVEMQLLDATNNQSIDGWFNNMFPNQYFTAAAGQSAVINFTVQVPYQFNRPVIIRFVARAGNVSDGEENSIPVLSNRQLVTETLPLNVRGTGTKNFKFDKLLQSGNSETLSHHAVTVEFTGNPAWYAVQSLPYLMEYPYECAEQIWNRVYANSLAAKIASSSPRIRQVFEKWKTTDTAALISNLQKNEELKSVLLQETPWVLEAKTETEQRKRIALLFDMVKLAGEIDKNLDQLEQFQSPNGGFVWFKGGPDDRYITQYILTGIGHLKKLNAIPAAHQQKINAITQKAIRYLDARLKDDYDRLVRSKADLSKQQISYIQINYLYMRSFFNEIDAAGNVAKPFNFYRRQAQLFWLKQNRYMQGMTALALYRTGDGKTASDILRSLKENAIVNEELGMYWKDMSGGYFWHQAPIETQALLIEAFTDISRDLRTVDALKTWLLKNRQTNSWRTTKATAEACYALLLQGTDWLSFEPVVQIRLGEKSISSLDEKTEAGSGYFKKVFDASSVTPSMGNISVSVTQPSQQQNTGSIPAAWGSVYWQYFENLENITTAETPLKLSKKLFIETNTDRGPVLEPVAENGTLKVGDKVKVRIELRVDRDMEYVHMKDMRASSLEPQNVLSGYKWQGGLGYYESTKDAGTNFFFDRLRKGTYVFEYALFVTHTGTFSNGITTIQCMYAPEFTSHSEGIKINVE